MKCNQALVEKSPPPVQQGPLVDVDTPEEPPPSWWMLWLLLPVFVLMALKRLLLP